MRRTLRVLVSSASRKAPLVEALRIAARRVDPAACVVAGDRDQLAGTQLVADEFWSMPPTEDEFAADLLAGCAERSIAAVLPTRDGELAFWARHRAAFAARGIDVLVSDHAAVAACLDKLEFSRKCALHGLPVIPSWESAPDGASGTLVVKERFGAGSRGIGLDLPREAALWHAARLRDPIFQPYERGPEVSIDGWMNRDGIPAGLVLRRRDRVSGGESQVTTTFRDPAIEASATAAFAALGLRGHAVMQAIVAEGGIRIVECNPRFGGASTASLAVGLDSLYWSLRESIDPSWQPAFERAALEVRQFRLPRDIIVHDPCL